MCDVHLYCKLSYKSWENSTNLHLSQSQFPQHTPGGPQPVLFEREKHLIYWVFLINGNKNRHNCYFKGENPFIYHSGLKMLS